MFTNKKKPKPELEETKKKCKQSCNHWDSEKKNLGFQNEKWRDQNRKYDSKKIWERNGRVWGDKEVERVWVDRDVDRVLGSREVESVWDEREVESVWGGRKVKSIWVGREVESVWGGREVERVWGGREVDRVWGGREMESAKDRVGFERWKVKRVFEKSEKEWLRRHV